MCKYESFPRKSKKTQEWKELVVCDLCLTDKQQEKHEWWTKQKQEVSITIDIFFFILSLIYANTAKVTKKFNNTSFFHTSLPSID